MVKVADFCPKKSLFIDTHTTTILLSKAKSWAISLVLSLSHTYWVFVPFVLLACYNGIAAGAGWQEFDADTFGF